MSDPIRDALEAAWRAMTVDPDDAPDGVIQHQRAAAAAAVAAFLWALPDETPLPPGGVVYLPRVARDLFAAAVERAAKEGA